VDQPTVLVVDDEPKIREIVRRYLQADGFAVTEQADGRTARPGRLAQRRRQAFTDCSFDDTVKRLSACTPPK
jgi:DNA-binding response OmpR family regulator